MSAEHHADIERLVGAAAGGDRTALHALIEHYLPRIRAYVRMRAGPALLDHESQADLVQSICRDLLECARRLRSADVEGFQKWLFTTAHRKLADRAALWSRQRRDPAREVADVHDEAAELLSACRGFYTPSQEASAREELARVEAALACMPAERREVILLARVLSLSRREVAARIGRTEAAVRMLLTRALADLALRVGSQAG